MATEPLARPVTKPRRRGGLADEVASHIRELILTGALRPGTKIDQEAIGEALDVSRSPIREAVVGLGKEGLLNVTPRRGAVVGPEDIVDHYELVGMVSGRAAAMAATSLSQSQIDELRGIHARFVVGTDADWSALNEEFHRIINQVAPRRTQWLVRLLVKSVPERYYEFADGWNTKAVERHAAILAAIVNRDDEVARQKMERHLRESGLAAAAVLRKQGFWDD